MGNEITERLDSVINLVEEMKDIILNGDADAPREFFEAAQDVPDQIGNILHVPLIPISNRLVTV